MTLKKRRIPRSSGFTLLELAMAVSVILILVMVAIPQFVEYTRKSEDSAAQADARAFLIAAVASAQSGGAKSGDAKGGGDAKGDAAKSPAAPAK